MNLYCKTFSGGGAEPLLLIHGNLASTEWWGPFLNEWQAAGSKIFSDIHVADWRGCGQNPIWSKDKPFTIRDLATDFLELMDQKNLKTTGLVGHSLGGLIALQMMILAPERFSRALLLDPVGAEGVVFDESMYDAFKRMAESADLTRTVILSTIQNSERIDDSLKNAIARDAYKAVRGIGSSVLEILKTVNLTQAASHIRTPVLILHGKLDQIILPADSQKLADILPNAKLELIEGVGHCWNVEDPCAFAERTQRWFSIANPS